MSIYQNRVRYAVKEVDGFEVVEEVVLGHFSFNKYLMWKDLIDRTDAMMKHPLVAALIDKTKKMNYNKEKGKTDIGYIAL